MVIYRVTDRIPVKLDDNITIMISPLSGLQKTAIMSSTKMKGGKAVSDGAAMISNTIKFCLKEIHGVDATFPNGDKFELEFVNGELTEDSLNGALQILDTNKMVMIASRLYRTGISSMEIEGVTVDYDNVKSVEAKKK